MKLQFDPNQAYQLDAVAAVVDLFDGQPTGRAEFSIVDSGPIGELFEGQQQTELGLGNRLLLDDEKLRANVRIVQARNDIEVPDEGAMLEGWDLFDVPADTQRACPHFSVEMETGTGKTYVYLRTIFELSKRYGFQKFVIVVPSVAIREGVLKNIEITAEHFRALYNNVPFEHFVYDAKNASRVRPFATSHTLQVMVINIDAFRKNFTGTDEELKSNVMYKPLDRALGYRAPIEFIQATRPIVIIDEPQSVDSTEKSQEAIKALNPLCTLRYSATHRNPYNVVYRLDPVRAFGMRLVKQIVVASATAEGTANEPFVRVDKIDYKPSIKAKLRIHVQTAEGPKEKSVTAKRGSDLFALSEERAGYQQGYSVAEISAEPGNEHVRFSNGRVLKLGDSIGGMREDVWRVQIKHTVKQHLEKELQVRSRGIKVLSLFFIDQVSNYRDYDGDQPKGGKFAELFEAELTDFAKDPRYAELEWLKLPVQQLHDGYFAQDKHKTFKDSREGRSSQDDEDAYTLIMKDKERLLSAEVPLRFIFSHSALREGWDNPNVFQICTLNATQSSVKKRQEIGRGLRLPVDSNGQRVFDESVNRLYVMANESYEDFAKALQTEYEKECGVTFGRVPITALAKLARVVDEKEQAIGRESAEVIRQSLVDQNFLDSDGRIQEAFDPKRPDFKLELPETHRDLAAQVVDLLSSYQIERHVRRATREGTNKLQKQVLLSPEFAALWDRIKPRTTYRVEFDTDVLVRRAIEAIKNMERIDEPKVLVAAGRLNVHKAGIGATAMTASEERVSYGNRPLPDILAYLQNETELTRSTLVRIIKGSDRLDDFFKNPQRFMDAIAAILRHELHRLLVDGIRYDKLQPGSPDSEWEMLLFKNEELINFLSAEQVTKSVYEYVVYESDVEREFARRLDQRDDIKLFVKLPAWFKVETPLGTYNPDWAILKQDGKAFYLVRETKSTRDFLKLRTSEADKVRCGQRHFEALGLELKVAVSAEDV